MYVCCLPACYLLPVYTFSVVGMWCVCLVTVFCLFAISYLSVCLVFTCFMFVGSNVWCIFAWNLLNVCLKFVCTMYVCLLYVVCLSAICYTYACCMSDWCMSVYCLLYASCRHYFNYLPAVCLFSVCLFDIYLHSVGYLSMCHAILCLLFAVYLLTVNYLSDSSLHVVFMLANCTPAVCKIIQRLCYRQSLMNCTFNIY